MSHQSRSTEHLEGAYRLSRWSRRVEGSRGRGVEGSRGRGVEGALIADAHAVKRKARKGLNAAG